MKNKGAIRLSDLSPGEWFETFNGNLGVVVASNKAGEGDVAIFWANDERVRCVPDSTYVRRLEGDAEDML